MPCIVTASEDAVTFVIECYPDMSEDDLANFLREWSAAVDASPKSDV